MNQQIITLGGGMIGSAISCDLKASGYSVTVADIDESIQGHLSPFGINCTIDFTLVIPCSLLSSIFVEYVPI